MLLFTGEMQREQLNKKLHEYLKLGTFVYLKEREDLHDTEVANCFVYPIVLNHILISAQKPETRGISKLQDENLIIMQICRWVA